MSKRGARLCRGPGGLLPASQPRWSRMRELSTEAGSPACGGSLWAAPGHRPASSHLAEGAADRQSKSGVPSWPWTPASPFSHL